MEDVLIVVPFLMNEHVDEQAGKVLSELEQIVNLHSICRFEDCRSPKNDVHAGSVATQPGGEETGVLDEHIASYGAD